MTDCEAYICMNTKINKDELLSRNAACNLIHLIQCNLRSAAFCKAISPPHLIFPNVKHNNAFNLSWATPLSSDRNLCLEKFLLCSLYYAKQTAYTKSITLKINTFNRCHNAITSIYNFSLSFHNREYIIGIFMLCSLLKCIKIINLFPVFMTGINRFYHIVWHSWD
jgi:hypothetical protein